MIVDDEPYNVLGLQLILGHMNIDKLSTIIDRAYNGLEAIKKVQDAHKNCKHVYGLIITDISMPIMDGFESS